MPGAVALVPGGVASVFGVWRLVLLSWFLVHGVVALLLGDVAVPPGGWRFVLAVVDGVTQLFVHDSSVIVVCAAQECSSFHWLGQASPGVGICVTTIFFLRLTTRRKRAFDLLQFMSQFIELLTSAKVFHFSEVIAERGAFYTIVYNPKFWSDKLVVFKHPDGIRVSHQVLVFVCYKQSQLRTKVFFQCVDNFFTEVYIYVQVFYKCVMILLFDVAYSSLQFSFHSSL